MNSSLLRMAVTATLSTVAAGASSADRAAGTSRRRWATATGPTPARGAVPRAKAQIVAEDESGVRIRVEIPGEEPVEITVPLTEGKPGIETMD